MIGSVSHVQKPELRILQVFSTLGVGGAETWLMSLLRHFDTKRNELPYRIRMDICLTSGNRGAFDDEATSLGARLFYPRYSRSSLPRFAREFRTILKNGRYDVIHDHQDYMAGIHFLIGLSYLPPIRIAHVHNPVANLAFFFRSKLRTAVLLTGKNLLANLATHITGTSRQVVSEYGFDVERFANVRRRAVYCGFDVSRFNGEYAVSRRKILDEFDWKSNVKILLFVGRLNSELNQKNPEFALQVAKLCIEVDPNVRFIMAGGGDDIRVELEGKVMQWGMQRSIRLIGARSDVPNLMSGSDLFLFPSVAEGLGMVAVEAQAAGLRVLASDAVPSECEAIPGMVTFLPLRAGVATWAKEVIDLMKLPITDSVNCNHAVRSSLFSIENSAATLIDIYTSKISAS